MQPSSSSNLLSDIGRPVFRALKVLAPHFKAIRDSWTKAVRTLKLETEDVESLFNLTLEGQYANLRSAKFDSYKLALERCGQFLDRRGVSPVHAVLAMSMYLDACCASLVDLGVREAELVRGLTHLTTTGQLCVVDGYSRQRWSSWWKVAEQERRRFSQNLHDEIGHNLVVLKLYLELMSMDFKKGKTDELGQKLEEAMSLVSQGIASVRRLILDLGPAMLEEMGLLASLRLYARQFTTRTAVQVQVVENATRKMPASHETALYRVVQGALSNVAKHAQAKNVRITIGEMKNVIVFVIEDDGVGFELVTKQPDHRFGLNAMRERIEALGGRFHVESRPAVAGERRHGTRIEVDLPLKGEPEK
ncbi:MAG: sensor histidine kinase [Acidobacteria bacterium]|nr:sensor histidine kinase [Acidobacteriota bacterium]